MLGPVYTELSVILLPGQAPYAPFDVATVIDSVALTLTEPTPAVVPTVNPVADTQSLTLVTESASIFGDASRSETWPLVYPDGSAIFGTADSAADTWTLTYAADTSSVDKGIFPLALSDSWAISVADGTLLAPYDINITELGAGGFSTIVHQYDPKASAGTVPLATNDVVTALWTESPFDLVMVDLWDDAKITFSAEALSNSIFQTYPSADSWLISAIEGSSVAYLGSLPVAASDAWALQNNEAPSVLDYSGNFYLAVSDTWALSVPVEYGQLGLTTSVSSDTCPVSVADSSALVITYDVRDATDSWAVQFADVGSMVIAGDVRVTVDGWTLTSNAEFGVPSNFLPLAIDVSDEMRAAFVDTGTLGSATIRPPKSRRIKVRRGRRHEDVEV